MIHNIFYFLAGFLICFLLLGILSLFISRQDQEIERLRDFKIPTKEEQDKLNESNLTKGL